MQKVRSHQKLRDVKQANRHCQELLRKNHNDRLQILSYSSQSHLLLAIARFLFKVALRERLTICIPEARSPPNNMLQAPNPVNGSRYLLLNPLLLPKTIRLVLVTVMMTPKKG